MGEHGCLGRACCAAGVTEGEALVGVDLEILMTDGVLKRLLLNQFPKVEDVELLAQLTLQLSLYRLVQDDVFQIGSACSFQERPRIVGSTQTSANIRMLETVLQVGQAESVVKGHACDSIQQTCQIQQIKLLNIPRVNS